MSADQSGRVDPSAKEPSLLHELNGHLPDATETARAVTAGATTAVRVIEAAREAAAGTTHAFITEDWDRALRVAEALDHSIRGGAEPGPLAGVPVSVKDIIAVGGLPLTAGSAAYAAHVAEVTAPAVQRLLDAGAILVGKTNCPEFAFGGTTESAVGGRAINPRFPSATPGGSSGGEAASVAAGASALGLGTDFGGSLRWPAQCVGIAAFRPSAQWVPDAGVVPGSGGYFGSSPLSGPLDGFQTETQRVGPLARSLRDLRTALAVLSGRPAPAASPPGDIRIAWSDGGALGPVRGEVRALMRALADRLAGEGHPVRHVGDLFEDCLHAYNAMRAADPMGDHASAVRGREDGVSASTLRLIQESLLAGPAQRGDAARLVGKARASASSVFRDADIVLLPVAGGPASDPNGLLDIDGRQVTGWDILAQCRAVTLTGAPVVSLPLAASSEGLPLSVQVLAAPGRDWKALDFAEEIEQVRL